MIAQIWCWNVWKSPEFVVLSLSLNGAQKLSQTTRFKAIYSLMLCVLLMAIVPLSLSLSLHLSTFFRWKHFFPFVVVDNVTSSCWKMSSLQNLFPLLSLIILNVSSAVWMIPNKHRLSTSYSPYSCPSSNWSKVPGKMYWIDFALAIRSDQLSPQPRKSLIIAKNVFITKCL